MVTADDDSVTDIVVEGDKEEIERLSKVCMHIHIFIIKSNILKHSK